MESISRLSGTLDTTRDLTLEASRNAGFVQRSPASLNLTTAQLKKLLDSRNEREVLDGLRRVIQYSRQQPPSEPPFLFSHVVKNIASPSLAVKKLVYIHLLAHAEREPDTALLAVNTIQKTLSASDPYLRALALRVMSGLRVPVIAQIVSLAIKKGCVDMSPVVRKAAALAIPKCWKLDPGLAPQLTEYLSGLLGDRQYFVAGAAVLAFMECCPERIEIIHRHYRSLVRKLVDMDEWSQLATLKLMRAYARQCFPRRKRRKKVNKADSQERMGQVSGFYEDPISEDNSTDDGTMITEVVIKDPDLTRLLDAAIPLLHSRNSAVVVAAIRLYLDLDPPASQSTYLRQAVGPLIALLRSAADIQYLAIHSVVHIMLQDPMPFVRYFQHFSLRISDSRAVAQLKLEALTLAFPHSPQHVQSLILSELAHFSRSRDETVVRASVHALGRCSQDSPQETNLAARCLNLLLVQLSSIDDELVSEALTVIRHLIQAEPLRHEKTIIHLAKRLDSARSPAARASIIWLIGEFAASHQNDDIAADVLRLLTKTFTDESEIVRLQIVQLAAKVLVRRLSSAKNTRHESSELIGADDGIRSPETNIAASTVGDDFEEHQIADERDRAVPSNASDALTKLYLYIHQLTRYDTSFVVRDLARTHRALLSPTTDISSMSAQLATLLLLAPKPVPESSSLPGYANGLLFADAKLAGRPLPVASVALFVDESLPEWVNAGEEPDPTYRNESLSEARSNETSASEQLGTISHQHGANPMGAPAAEKSLDDWLAEDESFGVANGELSSDTSDGLESEDESAGETQSEEDGESDSDGEDESSGLVR